MANLFFVSDHHFSHPLMANVRRFTSVEAMDQHMVDAHNRVVRPQDHVYFLGDVAMKRQMLGIVRRLNGHKRLIFGNHDIFEYKEYTKVGFEKLMSYRVIDRMIFSHIPLHTSSMDRFHYNVHGHLHSGVVRLANGSADPRYRCVCVEQTAYTPVPIEDLSRRL